MTQGKFPTADQVDSTTRGTDPGATNVYSESVAPDGPVPSQMEGAWMFTTNEGAWDRGLRALVGVGLVATLLLTEIFTGGLATAAWVVAAIMIVTAATGFCGLYAVFGVKTCRTK